MVTATIPEVNDAKLYQSYYTNSISIVKRMVSNLSININDLIFEPCGGNGVFVDEILNYNENAKIEVNELDLNAYLFLKNKYRDYDNICINHTDTLLDTKLVFSNFGEGYFDKIIANPPYGAWQDYSKRNNLKKVYKGLYIKETYTLFLYRCLQLLKNGGKLSFIIPDTYLNLHMHKSIRKYILENSKISEILLFPSSFFPGINFGYANLSIITLEKCRNLIDCLTNEITIIKNFKTVADLQNLDLNHLERHVIPQTKILNNADHAFLYNQNPNVLSIISDTKQKIGDVADCVTGFYSGNDTAFIKVKTKEIKNSKKYNIINNSEVHTNLGCDLHSLNGISGDRCFIPILKGGNTKYLKEDNWFIDWSEESVIHYKSNKKSRFQNSNFYFKMGLGVPMVSSTRITASLIDHKIFDQSIVGIFPIDKDFLYYLMGFFNSKTCNILIRTINPSANNPSNYIKKIPFIPPTSQQFETVDKLVKEIINQIKANKTYFKELDNKIDDIFSTIYGL